MEKATFSQMQPKWTDIGYAALATGDINHDGFPDIVAASHFGTRYRLSSATAEEDSPKGSFAERTATWTLSSRISTGTANSI